MTLEGIVNTARSLSYYSRLQEVTANNLANANSDGFKADRLAAHATRGSGHPVPVETTDLEQGSLKNTGRPLDVALEGQGFLVVRTPNGDRLTRGGSLRLDGAGLLVDAHGRPVLGTEDGPILVNGTKVEVLADGTVLVDRAPAGQLRIATVEDPTTLRKEGAGCFVPAGPLVPVPPTDTVVHQGAVEEANLDPLLSMVELVNIQRGYAANVEALKAMDSVLGEVTNEVGKV
ncbi:MAG TPA: flagellar hook basal-body protein [Terriglobales bacterium]|nr:flagellar hook basal-body protein [Terriglobales bacterium]